MSGSGRADRGRRPPKPGPTHRAVFAFDTELLERRPNRAYVAPSPQDAVGEQEFALAHLFRDIAAFLSDQREIPDSTDLIDYQGMDRSLDRRAVRRIQDGAKRRPCVAAGGDREALEHAARYVAFVQLLDTYIELPRIKLLDTISSDPTVKPVNVDLVLDIGNSRTCGMLIENFPNQQKVDLGNSFILQLRDLEDPASALQGPVRERRPTGP